MQKWSSRLPSFEGITWELSASLLGFGSLIPDPWVSEWAKPSCFSVPRELFTHPLLCLRSVLLWNLGGTSNLLRNPALINYPSVYTHLPLMWTLSLSRKACSILRRPPAHPLTHVPLTRPLPLPQLQFIWSHQMRVGRSVNWLCVCSLSDLWVFVPALEGPSQPTHCS